MSVDGRIREGLIMIEQELPEADTQAGYDVVVHEAAYRTFRHRALVLAAGAVTAGALTLSAVHTLGGADPLPEQNRPAGVAARAEQRPVRVDGTWRSAPVTADRLVRYLRSIDHGWRAGSLRGALPAGAHRLTLRFEHGSSTLSMGDEVVDRQTYTVDDDVMVLTSLRASGGENTYTFDVEGDTLTFTFFGTTQSPTRGVPAMPYQLALYTSVPFERVGR